MTPRERYLCTLAPEVRARITLPECVGAPAKGTLRARLRYARWRYRLFWRYRVLAGRDWRCWPEAAALFVRAFRAGVPCGWVKR